MALNLNKKKVCLFLKGIIFSVLAILVFTVGNSASAQPVFTDKLDPGLTSFYPDAASQQTKANTLEKLNYSISVPVNAKDPDDKPGGSISPPQQVEMLNELNKKVKKGNHLDRQSDDEGLAVHYQIPNLHQ
jgi:hypothetical protein